MRVIPTHAERLLESFQLNVCLLADILALGPHSAGSVTNAKSSEVTEDAIYKAALRPDCLWPGNEVRIIPC